MVKPDERRNGGLTATPLELVQESVIGEKTRRAKKNTKYWISF